MPLILFSQLKSVEMAQKQNCCVSDMGQMIPQIRSTTTTKTTIGVVQLLSESAKPKIEQIYEKIFLIN